MGERVSRFAGAVFLLCAGLANAATPLIVPVGVPKVGAKTMDTPVRFNREGLQPLPVGAEVELTLPDGSRHEYVYEQSIDHGGGFATWVARSPLTGDNERAVITYGPNGAWGWMRTTYGDYRIYPSGQGYDLLAKREQMNFAPRFKGGDAIEVGPDEPRIVPLTGVPTILDSLPGANALAKGLKATPSPVVQSDIMIIYTKDLAEKLGVGLLPMLYNVVASLNLAYSDSEVAISLRLVNATMIDYANGESPSPNGSSETLNAMGGSGANAAVFQSLTWGAGSLRDVVGADFVALLRDGPEDTGGIANLPKNPVIYPTSTVTSSAAYSVNNSCALGCEGLVAHEVGHNMGNHHDPATIAKDAGNGTVTSTGVFSYSYGYYSCANGLTCNPYTAGGCASGYATCAGPTNANDFGTIMSYLGPKPMKFSNPLLSNCVPPGGSAGAPRVCGGSVVPGPSPAVTSNNALSMNNVRGALSGYRNQTITNLPGSLQFTNTAYTGAEGSNLTFTVSRASGSSGAVSVTYTVTAGSATAGTDFVAGSGTLNWADGDGTSKTFNVALMADALVEGVETINATLSNPTGALGVYLGYPTIATGLIVEPWPLGTLGGLPTDPPGWITPASATASSVPWAIVNDSAPVGDPGGLSLKSGLLNFNGALNCTSSVYGNIPCPSAVEITRNFSAGTIAYAYRVSAFPNNGFLELLVDDVVVHSATGVSTNTAADTGWQFFSTTLSAGTHTLRWRYRPVFSFGCQFAGSGTPFVRFYPDCLDRAWIDQLALPANTAVGGSFTLTVARTGAGTVTSTPAGISCGATCSVSFSSGTVVALAATPAGGSTFGGWSGACSGTGACSVTMGAASSVTATFNTPLASTTTLVSSANPSTSGQAVAFTATVAGSGATPTGTVTFRNGTTAICSSVAMASGTAPCATSALSVATHSMTAEYSGSATYAASTSSVLNQVVAAANPPRLVNISTRGRVLTGADVMIGGFIIGGSTPKTVVIRANGPSLTALGLPGALANPMLQLFSGQTQIGVNDNWQTAANAATILSSGLAPLNTLESAIYTTLNPGPYTAIVSGAGGGTGVGQVEVFEVDRPDVPLINISTRGQVQTGNNVMIAGFIIQGSGPQTVVVRAIGPSLTALGLPGALANPMLQLFSGQTQVGVNDNWQQAANAATILSSGFAPSHTLESAILVTLNPGAYTAIVTGVGGTTGVGLVEVFAVP